MKSTTWFIEFKLPAGVGVGVGAEEPPPSPWQADINKESGTTQHNAATRRCDMGKLLGPMLPSRRTEAFNLRCDSC